MIRISTQNDVYSKLYLVNGKVAYVEKKTRLYIEAWPEVSLLVPTCYFIKPDQTVHGYTRCADISEQLLFSHTNCGVLSSYTSVTLPMGQTPIALLDSSKSV